MKDDQMWDLEIDNVVYVTSIVLSESAGFWL